MGLFKPDKRKSLTQKINRLKSLQTKSETQIMAQKDILHGQQETVMLMSKRLKNMEIENMKVIRQLKEFESELNEIKLIDL